MELNKDFRDLLFVLNENRVKYLVVAGFAYGFHAEPRGTRDLDLWVESDRENAEAVYKALAEYGAPIAGLSAADFSDQKSFLQ